MSNKNNKMRIALLQYKIIDKDIDRNFFLIEKKIRSAKLKNASVVVLPEVTFTGYCPDLTNNLKERIPGKCSDFLKKMSAKYRLCVIAGIIEDDGNKNPKNTCIVYNRGKLVHKYQKIHLFTYTDEHKHFSSGEGIGVFKLNGFNCSSIICYDLRFPELCRTLVKQNVNIIFVIANWPYPREKHWEILTKARAIESQAYLVAVNRVGISKLEGRSYFGLSKILDPWGEEIISAKKDKDCVVIGEVSIKRIREIRKNFPYLKDIKTNLYTRL